VRGFGDGEVAVEEGLAGRHDQVGGGEGDLSPAPPSRRRLVNGIDSGPQPWALLIRALQLAVAAVTDLDAAGATAPVRDQH
jgi:hypothetical protein